MNQQRSPWRRWLFGVAATTGLVAYALGAALMAQSAPEPPPQEVRLPQVTATFLHNDSKLSDNDREKLDVLAEIMKKSKNRMTFSVMIMGYAAPDEHTASGGNALILAQSRAQHAKDYLVMQDDIDETQIADEGEVCSPENDKETTCQKAVVTLN